jgi:hypothetical protein
MTKSEWLENAIAQAKDPDDNYSDAIEAENDIRTIVARRSFIERDDDHGENK